jgi:membrane protein insertase Oxa1/YidC/SpoIIIJ
MRNSTPVPKGFQTKCQGLTITIEIFIPLWTLLRTKFRDFQSTFFRNIQKQDSLYLNSFRLVN